MLDDARCCGSGTCIIDAEGRCWCGQQWNGEKMAPPLPAQDVPEASVVDHPTGQGSRERARSRDAAAAAAASPV